ncbi:HlyD family secretion protein [Marilutibacter aestuarii]|uniref:HlyD family efflux transporter periplasmic adaptor subunit n=1 Tax=Marilutibacter aestuarii TaxID=1706195 RepID=A0A507ZXF8_9GAMM|nr:HlyD family efflux transporter periplasmic adaptor subunit [Lysobacter aestuarii]TQD41647.1 HlyD family efflux transporter periplasmic adaptor subunit [Lysobacter aestuarii]
MTQTLFRTEVLEARRTSWLGGISLAQPIRLWVLTAAAVAIATIIILFLVFGTYTRRSRVVGQLVPVQGMATVLAPATGIVTRVDVPEGSRVEAGQTIAVVTMPRATVAGGDTQQALAQRLRRRQAGLESAQLAQHDLLSAQAAGLANQLLTARRELAQIEAEIATREQQVQLANETLDRLRQLREGQYVSELQLKQQESSALDQVGEMQVLQRQAISTRRMIAQLQQASRELPGQRRMSDAGYERDIALLEQEQLETSARGEPAIIAPVSGVIATQLFKPGQAVQAGQALMSVLPGDGALEAELLVPSRAIGFIEPGDSVLLRYQAYPYQKFGHHQGRVARISRSTVNPAQSDATSEPFYRINVALDRQAITAYGEDETLKPGMLLDADVLGERRTLIEWVLEPLYSIQGSVFGR